MINVIFGQGFKDNDSKPLISIRRIMEPGYDPYERRREPDHNKHKLVAKKSGGIIRPQVMKNDK